MSNHVAKTKFINGENTMKLIKGMFIEGKKVYVEIDGKKIERTVRYNNADGLYIMYKNSKYFEYECDYSEIYKNK